jgi:hypothetical protein
MEADLLDNKDAFAVWCSDQGFTVPATAKIYQDGLELTGASSESQLPSCDLFSKPAGGREGLGARLWLIDSAGLYESDGVCYMATEVEALLKQQSREPMNGRQAASLTGHDATRILLQERVLNHATVWDLSDRALCTSRVVTGRFPGKHAFLIDSMFRMPVGTADVDNLHRGGDCVVHRSSNRRSRSRNLARPA